MATLLSQRVLCCSSSCKSLSRTFCTSVQLYKNLRAGKKQYPKKGEHNFTYEEINPPYTIGVRKSWNSWNTTNLHGESGAPQVIFEDIFIRKFLAGTFPLVYEPGTEIMIRRRQNMIDITMVTRETLRTGRKPMPLHRMHFLHGYSEELLSRYLKCPVKLDIQCMDNHTVLKDTVF